MLDLRQQQYFKDEESFHRGMKILQEYLKKDVDNLTFSEAEDVLFGLIDDTTRDMDLLERSLNYHNSLSIEERNDPLSNQLSILSDLVAKLQTASNTAAPSKETTGIALEGSFEEFLKIKKINWKKAGGMEKSYRQTYFPILKEVFGQVKTGDLTKSNVNELIQIVTSIPSNRHKIKEFKNLSLRDFLKTEIPKEQLLSPVTLKKYLDQFGTYFRWLKSVDYSLINLDEPLKNIKINRPRSQDQKDKFTKEEIRKLFNSKQYVNGTHKKPSEFWVPLIALYTGARLNEICQLSMRDCYEDESLKRWVFNFNEDPSEALDKSIKKPHHKRPVPFHKRLIELGFLEFIKFQKSKKATRVFSELPYVSDENKYGDKIQRWFNRTYKKNCGITSENTSFHSLRHTVITHLVNEKDVDPNKIATGLGQVAIGGVTQTTYTKPLDLKEYSIYFDKIDFDDCYEIDKIRRWDCHVFHKNNIK
jgi:integrase